MTAALSIMLAAMQAGSSPPPIVAVRPDKGVTLLKCKAVFADQSFSDFDAKLAHGRERQLTFEASDPRLRLGSVRLNRPVNSLSFFGDFLHDDRHMTVVVENLLIGSDAIVMSIKQKYTDDQHEVGRPYAVSICEVRHTEEDK